MVIGVDIDGVLCNLNRYTWKYFKKFLKEKKIPFKFNKSKVKFYQQFNVTPEIEDEFWERYAFDYAKKVRMSNHASFYMNKLHKAGHKLIIITSRTFSYLENEKGEKMREAVKKWLAKNKIYYDKIYFCYDKAKVIREEKVDVMLEDSPENIENLSKIVPVIIFKNPANKFCKGKNKILINGWKDLIGGTPNFLNAGTTCKGKSNR